MGVVGAGGVHIVGVGEGGVHIVGAAATGAGVGAIHVL